MNEMKTMLSSIEALLDLAPEELAAKILPALKEVSGRPDLRNILSLNGFISYVIDGPFLGQVMTPFTDSVTAMERQRREKNFTLAVEEAWAWMVAQGLLIVEEGINGRSGYFRLSRRADKISAPGDFYAFKMSRRLARESLHERIANKVWGAFIRADFDVAVFSAMKAVEVAVREAAGLGDGCIGTKLMREAFNPEAGILTDKSSEEGERVARAHLFAGVIGSYKNPQSHRDVNLDNAQEALEIIYLANHLLKIVDACVERLRSEPSVQVDSNNTGSRVGA